MTWIALSLAPLPQCGVCRIPHLSCGFKVLGDHLRTADTGGFAFLLPPPALRSDGAWRQFIDDGWQPLHDLCRQAAFRCFRGKVCTPAACTGRGNAEDFAWPYRA